jgi:SAM-dependent methyltransferase
VTFEVAADSYARFMGRFSEPLAAEFVRAAGVQDGDRVLDVGCGPGALTYRLVEALGEDAVTAIDPSAPFVAAVQARFPGVDVHLGSAERLPYSDAQFDRALAQLVVQFMADPVAGLREMARVTRPGGVVAASVWDHAGGRSPLSLFWRAVEETYPQAPNEDERAGAREGQLTELAEAAGLRGIDSTALTVRVRFSSFAQWWEPYLLGVGPAGDYVASLDEKRREELRVTCERLLPHGSFELDASAWCVVAHA